jgi:hypothetical protein
MTCHISTYNAEKTLPVPKAVTWTTAIQIHKIEKISNEFTEQEPSGMAAMQDT